MVRLYDYVVPVADSAAGIPALPAALADLPTADRKTLLTSLFKPERMPGSMERLTTLVADVDVATAFLGPYGALAHRRGWTHGVLALAILPFVVAGTLLLYDRYVRLRRNPLAAPARAGPLLGLAALAVLSHPALDWLNNYGMRWLMPFDGTWFYGDALFIVDPWVWLGLGGVADEHQPHLRQTRRPQRARAVADDDDRKAKPCRDPVDLLAHRAGVAVDVERRQAPTSVPTGQATPVPPRPQ